MMNSPGEMQDGCVGLLLVALGVGLMFPLTVNAIFAISGGLDIRGEWFALSVQCIISVGPFIILVMTGLGNRWSWGAAILVTGALWGYYLFDALSRSGSGTGPNIGLAVMLGISPIVISIVALAVGRATSTDFADVGAKRRRGDSR